MYDNKMINEDNLFKAKNKLLEAKRYIIRKLYIKYI
jgi:hypothetical protein